jgi:hypothetical protein
MNEKQTKTIAAVGLFTGGIFGIIGSLVSSASFRGFAWGVDGIALILAGTLLTVYYFRKGYDTLAAGFLMFAIGEGLVLSCNAADLDKDISSFCAGTSLWAASLALISFQNVFPKLVRFTGFIAAILFFVVSVQTFSGGAVNALTEPLPFYAYPFFATTIFGWGWILLKTNSR